MNSTDENKHKETLRSNPSEAIVRAVFLTGQIQQLPEALVLVGIRMNFLGELPQGEAPSLVRKAQNIGVTSSPFVHYSPKCKSDIENSVGQGVDLKNSR